MIYDKILKIAGINTNFQFKRHLWPYVNIAFNRVDLQRLQDVGPDRTCAEWILKNGGAIRFESSNLYAQYNSLPDEKSAVRLKEVDASNSSIMKIGFAHFKDCDKLEKIILHCCTHMENEALSDLDWAKKSLRHLQVSSCYNVRADGILMLKNLTQLQNLRLFDLPYVENLQGVVADLQKHLPKCKINSEPPESEEKVEAK